MCMKTSHTCVRLGRAGCYGCAWAAWVHICIRTGKHGVHHAPALIRVGSLHWHAPQDAASVVARTHHTLVKDVHLHTYVSTFSSYL